MTILKIKIYSDFESKEYSINESKIKRDWMDETYKSHAYRCLPLSSINTHGWTINLETDCVVNWNGGPNCEDVKIINGPGVSHVPGGFITFKFPYFFVTDPNYYILCTGQPNYFREDMSPLSGLIRSDWYPSTFNFVWKLHNTGETVFPKGMPIMFFIPYPKDLIDNVEVEVYNNKPIELSEKSKKYSDHIVKSDKKMRESEDPWKEWVGLYRFGKVSEDSDLEVSDANWMPKSKKPRSQQCQK